MAFPQIILVIGGARSGKSRLALTQAQALAVAAGKPPGFIATAEALDDEMTDRIARHKAERGADWQLAEAPLDVAGAIASLAPRCGALVIDCLTLWLSNLMHHECDVDGQANALLDVMAAAACPVICVSNEVGLGLVPETPLGRAFRDAQGRLNQQVAAAADAVAFVAAGLPLMLKGTLTH